MTIRVLIADDERLIRSGLRMILEVEADIEVVAEAEDGVIAVEQARLHQPDVVLMDLRMPRLNGVDATVEVLRSVDPPPRVLVVTTFDTDQDVYRALQAGAAGYLLKDAPEARIVSAVRGAADGATVLDQSVARQLLASVDAGRTSTVPPAGLGSLTARELDVLRLLAQGLSNAGIARRLMVGEATVKTHVARVLTKLGLSSRSEAVVVAYESGLVRPQRGSRP